jgi:hypothetical protein
LAWMSALYGGLAVPAVFGIGRIRGWLGRRRNHKGLCGVCRSRLYAGGDAPSLIMGVLHCPGCTARARRDLTLSLWVVAGFGLTLPVLGGLGLAGLLPFVYGGVSAAAVAGLLLPPVVVGGVVAFEMRLMKRANETAALPDPHGFPELESGE